MPYNTLYIGAAVTVMELRHFLEQAVQEGMTSNVLRAFLAMLRHFSAPSIANVAVSSSLIYLRREKNLCN